MDNALPFTGKTAACRRWRASAVQPCKLYRHTAIPSATSSFKRIFNQNAV
ncbi:hypothetical protein NEICINOT_04051 [Neisseria cinerea ATCC 14685]|uniref:Uncharacterized protein n=1 Tax=Neisseria cinerea ATCC 14685 TaxID=546262 RepID=D0W316_NEICI|nr:hypothetical protein NEICINOT_04051 [Neisseria cinerea ATCC 14685]